MSVARSPRERIDPDLDDRPQSVFFSGVQSNNTDLPIPTHVPTVVEAGTAPLPGHEHQLNHPGEGSKP